PTLFPYTTAIDHADAGAEAVWKEHRESTRGRDLDITGLSYALIEAAPRQWPFAAGQTEGRARLYEDGVFATDDGRARFAAEAWQPLAEPRDTRYPLSLTTGRLRDQWHGMSRTGTLGRLFGHVPEPVVQMHPEDMARRQLSDGDMVYLTSRRGSVVVPVAASDTLAPAQTFMAMHWGPEYLGGQSSSGLPLAGINALTTPAHCPVSKQPELKHTAVKVLKAELPWSLLAMAWLPADRALAVRAELRALAGALPFVSCVPFSASGALAGADASPPVGVLLRAAAHDAPGGDLLARIESLLGLAAADTLRYTDARRGQHRAVRLRRDGGNAYVQAVLLAGDTRAQHWLRTLLQDQLPAQSLGRQLLAPTATAPKGVAARGKVVCSCFGVAENTIQIHLARCEGSEDERLASLQGALKCGTNCGSCVPELRRLVRATERVT
ncbi:MAG: nitrate reductase, partial [Comamonadaceae bacterium]